MKYFGIFDSKTLDLTDIEIENLMLEKGLLVTNSVAKGENFEEVLLNFHKNQIVNQNNPSEELVQEYYKFIIDLYQAEILKIKLPFFKKFNDAIFGLEHNDQKKIALKHFKEIYSAIYKDAITFFNETINNDGIVHTNPIDKLKMLYYQLEAYKNNLSGTRTSMYYLVGDRQTYIDSNFIENEIVSEVVEFEAWKQVLVELNSRYGFEDDYYFSDKFQDDVNFIKYNKIFKRLEAYQFTNTKIKGFKKDEKAKSVSLYQVLINKNLIIENKEEFKRFMKAEYGFSPAEIITYEKDINRTHDGRVVEYLDDWEKFDAKK